MCTESKTNNKIDWVVEGDRNETFSLTLTLTLVFELKGFIALHLFVLGFKIFM